MTLGWCCLLQIEKSFHPAALRVGRLGVQILERRSHWFSFPDKTDVPLWWNTADLSQVTTVSWLCSLLLRAAQTQLLLKASTQTQCACPTQSRVDESEQNAPWLPFL